MGKIRTAVVDNVTTATPPDSLVVWPNAIAPRFSHTFWSTKAPSDLHKIVGVIACGQYSYNELTKLRSGGLTIFGISYLQDSHTDQLGETARLSELLDIRTEFGILDMRPLSQSDASCGSDLHFICACSDVRVRHYKVTVVNHTIIASIISVCDQVNADLTADVIGLCVSVPGGDTRYTNFSRSDGIVVNFNDQTVTNRSWQAHKAEVWCVETALAGQSDICATGADDCSLCLWDMRTDLNNPVLRNSSEHTMGVTAIANAGPHTFYSGSYDEYVRQWDSRALQRPVYLKKASGGIWRIRCDPGTNHMLISACHGGAEIWGALDQGWEFMCTNNSHDSMVYGLEAFAEDHSTRGDPSSCAFVSCSFYDMRMCLWRMGNQLDA